ncbi:MAG: hypothetical protein J2P21_07315 [Chloracidobacterium sp.]|nr:hypothetical protein [Chloracidobacterium sp.]
MDSNYRNGLVFSDGQQVAQELHAQIQSFDKREKHTRRQIKEKMARDIKKIDLSQVTMVIIEDLKRVKDGKRGTFSRKMNNWLFPCRRFARTAALDQRGAAVRKGPWKTTQHYPACGKWEKTKSQRR